MSLKLRQSTTQKKLWPENYFLGDLAKKSQFFLVNFFGGLSSLTLSFLDLKSAQNYDFFYSHPIVIKKARK